MDAKLQEFYESLDPNKEEDKKILDEIESSKVDVPELDEMQKSLVLAMYMAVRKLDECPEEEKEEKGAALNGLFRDALEELQELEKEVDQLLENQE